MEILFTLPNCLFWYKNATDKQLPVQSGVAHSRWLLPNSLISFSAQNIQIDEFLTQYKRSKFLPKQEFIP